jgi:hypothetical protein
MTIDQRIKAFVAWGEFLKQFAEPGGKQGNPSLNEQFYEPLAQLIRSVHIHNGWFTEENVRSALRGIVQMLDQEQLLDWVSRYITGLSSGKQAKNVAIIMAGNIPLVGFHDMLCVLLSGNKCTAKLSSEDKLLLPAITKVLTAIEPAFADYIVFTDDQLKNIEAVIATGSNNSARYFEYYFGKYPHIIRKNRNSPAVLTGEESETELQLLGKDIFQYFGLGCRNVSKLFVPAGYKFDAFYEGIYGFRDIINNNKYGNNYEYNRTVYLMNAHSSLLDNNFLLLKEDSSYSSPIGVLFYEFYDDLAVLNSRLQNDRELIQCIVSKPGLVSGSISFGEAQQPKLYDYADGVDTMQFLMGL